jgi:hypothetical protein
MAANSDRDIRGQVTDPAGASIPGAVVIANSGHGTARSATTDLRGEYVLANLPAEAYTVRVSAKGFSPADRTDVALASGATQVLDFPLSVASDKQIVTVSDSGQSEHAEVDPSANADALVMRGSDLDALSDDPDDLAADLAALAGPGAGPNGGRLPAKSSIPPPTSAALPSCALPLALSTSRPWRARQSFREITVSAPPLYL